MAATRNIGSPSFNHAYHRAHSCRTTMEAPGTREARTCLAQESFEALKAPLLNALPFQNKAGNQSERTEIPFQQFLLHVYRACGVTQEEASLQGINDLHMLLCFADHFLTQSTIK